MQLTVITSNINKQSGWGRYSSAIISEYPNFSIDCRVITDKGYGKCGNEDNILLSLDNVANFFRNLFRVRKLARSSDIVHAFDGWPYAVYGYAAVWGTKKKLFINGVGTYSVEPFNNLAKAFLLSLAYRRAKNIFCISNYTKKKILGKIKLNNILTVFLGVPDLPLISDLEIGQYKIKYKINDEYPIFLTVGSLKNRKGQYDSLQAISKLKREYPKFKYFMIGSDVDKNYIRLIKDFAATENIADKIEIIGAADDKILSFFYQISDIFLLNSNNTGDSFEGFGLVLLEAACFGLPVIASRDCGIEDALRDGYNGYLVGQHDHDDVADRIKLLLKQDKKKLAENSRNFAGEFSWRQTVSKYYEYYQKN
ncbi:MAG: hypothetical protein C3F02_00325 [Parcubacteria group bacterium]|nr:MAG: hypothetical protein C3F02_00325 [Parcubacteria group bacterium]